MALCRACVGPEALRVGLGAWVRAVVSGASQTDVPASPSPPARAWLADRLSSPSPYGACPLC
eukprot:5737653-Alexandrium_andersonii.AAC.1